VLLVAYSADGKRLATTSRASAGVWDIATSQQIATGVGSGAPATMAFAGNGRFLAVGGQDGTVVFWDVDSGRPVGPIIRHPTSIAAMSFSSAADCLLVASQGNTEADGAPAVVRLHSIRAAKGTTQELSRWFRQATALKREGGSVRVLDAETLAKER
jgi:WD40 repeat protein